MANERIPPTPITEEELAQTDAPPIIELLQEALGSGDDAAALMIARELCGLER